MSPPGPCMGKTENVYNINAFILHYVCKIQRKCEQVGPKQMKDIGGNVVMDHYQALILIF